MPNALIVETGQAQVLEYIEYTIEIKHVAKKTLKITMYPKINETCML